MVLRLHVEPSGTALVAGARLELPASAVRHAQVRRVQPGDAIVLFDGSGREADAVVLAVGRREVTARVLALAEVDRELPLAVTLAVGMPGNERMDALVEKATELGMAALQPLLCERSVLRLAGERAERRIEHWRAVAVSAAEQCGRTRVPAVAPVQSIGDWLAAPPTPPGAGRWLLSLGDDALAPEAAFGSSAGAAHLVVLSGPEGGLAPAEEAAARTAGFVAVSLGPRVLRADTAPLALLAWLGLREGRRARG